MGLVWRGHGGGRFAQVHACGCLDSGRRMGRNACWWRREVCVLVVGVESRGKGNCGVMVRDEMLLTGSLVFWKPLALVWLGRAASLISVSQLRCRSVPWSVSVSRSVARFIARS